MDCECSEKKLLDAQRENHIDYFNMIKHCYLGAFTASPFRVQVAWRDVVQFYTELSLSYSKDTLPALSGITKKFIELRPGDRYLAGLWERSFVQDLIWSPTSYSHSQKSGIHPRPEKWRAPTWSWASVDSSISTWGVTDEWDNKDKSRMDPFVEVLAVDCVAAGDDITGELSSGYAILRGSILAGHFGYRPQTYGSHWMTSDEYETSFRPDYTFDVDTEFRVQDGDRIFCLRIATENPRGEDTSDDFLVLRKKCGMIDTFERIGSMTVAVDGDDFYRIFESRREECTLTIV